MKLNELINFVLFEANPVKFAKLLDDKANDFFNDGQKFDTLFNILYSEIKLSNGKIPLGNNKYVNIQNKKEVIDYFNTIKANLKTTNTKTLEVINLKIQNFLDNLPNEPN